MSQDQSSETAVKKLRESEELLHQGNEKLQILNEDIKKENEKWIKDKARLEEEHEKLQREVEQLEKEKEHVDRLTSLFCDPRKMYGDMTPGDMTHHDVTLLYQNHFKSSHRNMPKKLDKTKSGEKYEIWEKSAEIVQKAFDTNKTRLVKMMLKKVKEAVTEDHEELDETTYDLQRAFEMFLQTDYFKEVVAVLDLIIGDDEDKKLVMDILLTLKPDDYLHFIKNGRPRERKLQEIKFDE